MADTDRRPLFRAWVFAFTLGEVLGFVLIPVLGGFAAVKLTTDQDPAVRSVVLYVVAIVGGLGEGATLAAFQYPVLERVFPDVRRRSWIGHTALAASAAWAAGMLAPLLDDLVGLGAGAQIAIWIPAGILILLSIGGAQARVLSRHTAHARRWLAGNVLGWLLGLPWTFLLPAAIPDDAPVWAFAVSFGVAGVLMALTAALITARVLVRLARG